MRKSFLLANFVISFASFGLSSPVTKCKSKDASCMKQSAQDLIPKFAMGIPELGVQALDPLVLVKDIDASSRNLKLVVKNMVITGLKGCIAQKIERDVKNSKIKNVLQCNVEATGDYEMKGSILIIPIEGAGKAKVVLNKIEMEVEDTVGEKVGKDGKKHWYIKNSKFTYKLKDKSYLNFENLFPNNKLLAQAAYELINSNPNDIILEIGQPVVKAIVDRIVENVNQFYRAVPIDELVLN